MLPVRPVILLSNAGNQLMTTKDKMGELVSAMQDIKNSSNQIRNIIKTIEDIAFQTNILALNAAVEAARAGAAGRGFAVVADEVRNLASKSSEASKNTSALIADSIVSVERGSSIVDEVAGLMDATAEGARAAVSIIDTISQETDNEAQAIKQVTVGIDQISSVVQTNSATAEQSAAASEELSGQANMLRELISGFKLRMSAPDLPGSPSECLTPLRTHRIVNRSVRQRQVLIQKSEKAGLYAGLFICSPMPEPFPGLRQTERKLSDPPHLLCSISQCK